MLSNEEVICWYLFPHSVAYRCNVMQILNPRLLAMASVTKEANSTSDGIAIPNAEDSRDAKRKRVDSELDIQMQIQQAKKRERVLRERLEREEAENKRRIEKEREEQERRERAVETPRDALHRLYEPIFHELWEMEFAVLGGTNPFRMVIDASTCTQMGIPDYCDVI